MSSSSGSDSHDMTRLGYCNVESNVTHDFRCCHVTSGGHT